MHGAVVDLALASDLLATQDLPHCTDVHWIPALSDVVHGDASIVCILRAYGTVWNAICACAPFRLYSVASGRGQLLEDMHWEARQCG